VLACATPALELVGEEHWSMCGGEALLAGPLALFIGQFSWIANLFLGSAMVLALFGRMRAAAVISLAGLALANHAWTLFGQEIPGDEGLVTKYALKSMQIGFYLWLASFLILATAALATQRRSSAPM